MENICWTVICLKKDRPAPSISVILSVTSVGGWGLGSISRCSRQRLIFNSFYAPSSLPACHGCQMKGLNSPVLPASGGRLPSTSTDDEQNKAAGSKRCLITRHIYNFIQLQAFKQTGREVTHFLFTNLMLDVNLSILQPQTVSNLLVPV